MSSVFLGIGQAGNQIAGEIERQFIQKYSKDSRNRFVFQHFDEKFRFIHCDSERKVVNQLRKQLSKYLREDNLMFTIRGRGSNWAAGYKGLESENNEVLMEKMMNSIRKEIEKCHSFSGFVIFHSSGGGTGSGFGSYVTERLRDFYPTNYLLNCLVFPHNHGESPLQSYNTALTVSTLQENSDGICSLFNDDVLRELEKRNKRNDVDDELPMTSLNQRIAHSLLNTWLPTDSITSSSTRVSLGLEVWELLRSVCVSEKNKFFRIDAISRRNSTIPTLWSNLLPIVKRRNNDQQSHRMLSCLGICRGTSFDYNSLGNLRKMIFQDLSFVDYNPFPLDCWLDRGGAHLKESGETTLAVCSNSTHTASHLETVVGQCHAKLNVGAYLHWYQKYHCDKERLLSALETCQEIIDAYHAAEDVNPFT